MAPDGARRDAEQVRHAVLVEVLPVGEIDDGSLARTEVGKSAAHVEIAIGGTGGQRQDGVEISRLSPPTAALEIERAVW